MDISSPDKLRLVNGTKELALLTPVSDEVLTPQTSSDEPHLPGLPTPTEGEIVGASLYLNNGGVIVRDEDGHMRAQMVSTTVHLYAPTGANIASLGVGEDSSGANESHGELILRNQSNTEIVKLRAQTGDLTLGNSGAPGDVRLRDGNGETRIHFNTGSGSPNAKARIYLDGSAASLVLGSNDKNGDVQLLDASGKTRIQLNSDNGQIKVLAPNGDLKVHIDGDAGDIILPNADCAEDFVVAEVCEPGTVMVIDRDGTGLCASSVPYDRKVAGVLSGAGDLRPGIVLGRSATQEHRMPLALVGRVYCRVDAREMPIEVGDLLTTSATPGHAMKVTDQARAFGAVIGKALQPLVGERGLIAILVALQ